MSIMTSLRRWFRSKRKQEQDDRRRDRVDMLERINAMQKRQIDRAAHELRRKIIEAHNVADALRWRNRR
jgi:hypothetical protein